MLKSYFDTIKYKDTAFEKDIVRLINKTCSKTKPYNELKAISSELDDMAENVLKPPLIVIVGEFKTGKSSFINMLLGEKILIEDITPATAVVTMLSYNRNLGIKAHYKNGECKDFQINILKHLSSEDESEYKQMRKELKYIEVMMPNPLLKSFTLVDTPGLNSIYSDHTEATNFFLDQADIILWIFSYSQAVTQTEIAKIKSFNTIKPIAIINRIDEHIDEEGSLEDFLLNVHKKLHDCVADIFGVSTLWAYEAKNSKNSNLLLASRWHEIDNLLFQNLYANSKQTKCVRTTERLSALLKDLIKQLNDLDKTYRDNYNYVFNHEYEILKLQKEIDRLSELSEEWLAVDEPEYLLEDQDIEYYFDYIINSKENIRYMMPHFLIISSDLPTYQGELNKQREIILETYRLCELELNPVIAAAKQLRSDKMHYDVEMIEYLKRQEDFDKQGIILSFLTAIFTNEEAKLNKLKMEMEEAQIKLSERVEKVFGQFEHICSKFIRLETEAEEYCDSVIKAISDDILIAEHKINNSENLISEATQEIKRLKWIEKNSPKMIKLLYSGLTKITTKYKGENWEELQANLIPVQKQLKNLRTTYIQRYNALHRQKSSHKKKVKAEALHDTSRQKHPTSYYMGRFVGYAATFAVIIFLILYFTYPIYENNLPASLQNQNILQWMREK